MTPDAHATRSCRARAYYYVLPFLSVFLIVVGGQAIGMRSMCIYELGTDYVKYAKLLGIKESKILFYMFRNAMLPQLTGLALVARHHGGRRADRRNHLQLPRSRAWPF